ncbi:MAG: farnesyl-diphosphate synthase [Bacillales bacterium]|nr:farnesyl-diphosphate synthase [Bacillales bacterium]
MSNTDFENFFNSNKIALDNHMLSLVNKLNCPAQLKESIQYSLSAGGKRIRPILTMATLDALKKNTLLGLDIGSAIEMIHTYSLIHDDLPSMDNDDYRRGKLTNHKVYGEDIAILAGDSLLTYAFELVANSPQYTSDIKVKLISELAKAAGPEGMVAGQVLDMQGEGKDLSLNDLEHIHINKTGKMLMISVISAGIIAGSSEIEIERLRKFALLIGLAFQIQDDILDYVGDEAKIGKRVGSDLENNKSTYVSIFSLEKAKELLHKTYEEAIEQLKELDLESSFLVNICELIVKRDY